MVQTKVASVLICHATDATPVRSERVSHVESIEAQVVSAGTIRAAAPVVPLRNVVGRANAAVAVAAGNGEEEGPLGGSGVVGTKQVAGGVGTLPGAAGV